MKLFMITLATFAAAQAIMALESGIRGAEALNLGSDVAFTRQETSSGLHNDASMRHLADACIADGESCGSADCCTDSGGTGGCTTLGQCGCRSLGERCNENRDCCDGAGVCAGATTTLNGRCECLTYGETCSSDAECCDEGYGSCTSTGKCGCRADGEACNEAIDCCSPICNINVFTEAYCAA